MSAAPPSGASLFQYGFFALPLAFAGLPLYVHAPDFYTRDLGLSVGWTGVILLAVRMFDAVQDPVIGYVSDKCAQRRFGIMAGGAFLLATGMMAVFYGPQFGVPVAAWFAFSMILATTGFSVATINLNMIGGFWHDEPDRRTRISAWRECFALAGLLVASVLPAFLQSFKPAEESFRILFWIFGAVMVAGFVAFTCFMRRIPPGHKIMTARTQKGLSFLPILVGPDRRFFGVCFLTYLASSMPAVLVLFFVRDYLGAENLSGLFLFLYFAAGAALMGIWVRLAGRFGKEQAWLASMLLAVAAFIWAFFLQPGDVAAYGIICVLSGTALGADLALPPSILADRVTRGKTESEATQYYALLAFIPKTAIAIAGGASFIVLDRFGFVAGAENPPETMQGLLTLYALVPCAIKLIASYSLWCLIKHERDRHQNFKRSAAYELDEIS